MKPPDGEPGRAGRGAAPHERIRVLVVSPDELAETVMACLDDPAGYREGLRHAS